MRKVTWTAFVVLAAALIFPAWVRSQTAAPSAPPTAAKADGLSQTGAGGYGDLREVTLRGTVIALGEELARAYGAATQGAGPDLQYALRLPDGTLYTFLDNGHYRELIDGGKRKSQPVEVKARQFPKSTILEVISFRPLPADALRRVYYCRTCKITTYEPGPCVCCGQEVELLPEGMENRR
jgi:hypothetical protein